MKNKKVLLYSAFAMSMGLASCVNENYDLSNIDTTVDVKMKDLTLALKMNAIKLDKILDLKDGDQLKKVYDNATKDSIYAVVESGDFSTNVDISGFTATAPKVNLIQDALPMQVINDNINKEFEKALDDFVNENTDLFIDQMVEQQQNELKKQLIAMGVFTPEQIEQKLAENIELAKAWANEQLTDEKKREIADEVKNDPNYRKQAQDIAWDKMEESDKIASYDITSLKETVNASSDNVHEALRELSHINAETELSLSILLTNLTKCINVSIQNTQVQLPKGLYLKIQDGTGKDLTKNYERATGVLNLGNVALGKDGKYDLDIKVEGFDVNSDNASVVFTPGAEGEKGQFKFSSDVFVKSGSVIITKADFINNNTIFTLPDNAEYSCEVNVKDIKVNSVDGAIAYDIDAPTINPVKLNNLPDILNDEGTDIKLGNPQIYLTVNNPIYADGLTPQLGLKITALRDNDSAASYEMDKDASGNPTLIKLSKEMNDFCISPEKLGKDQRYKDDKVNYAEAEQLGFKQLSSVLSGKGLPKELQVDVVNPVIPKKNVTGFELGRSFTVQGDYLFYAPLSLGMGSVIQYSDRVDGWYDDVMDDLNITEMKLTAKVENGLPLDATLTLTPIDKDGKKISNIKCSPFVLKAGESEQTVNFTLTSTTGFRGLDGIDLVATVVASNAEKVLKPISSIYFKEVKVSVSGDYIVKDND